jgi:hypothetical protein
MMWALGCSIDKWGSTTITQQLHTHQRKRSPLEYSTSLSFFFFFFFLLKKASIKTPPFTQRWEVRSENHPQRLISMKVFLALNKQSWRHTKYTTIVMKNSEAFYTKTKNLLLEPKRWLQDNNKLLGRYTSHQLIQNQNKQLVAWWLCLLFQVWTKSQEMIKKFVQHGLVI